MSLEGVSAMLDESSGDFHIKGKFCQDYSNVYLYMERELPGTAKTNSSTSHITIPIETNHLNHFKIKFNLNEFVKEKYFNNSAVWYSYFIVDGKKELIKSNITPKSYAFPSNNLFKVTAYQNDTLKFKINSDKVNPILTRLEVEDQKLIVNIKTDHVSELIDLKAVLSLKCREQKNLFKYYKSLDLTLSKSFQSEANEVNYCLEEFLSTFLPYLNDYKIFDLYFELINENGTLSEPLTTKTLPNSDDTAHNFHIKTYKNRKDQVSLAVNLNLKTNLMDINIKNGILVLNGKTENFNEFKNNINSDFDCEFIIKEHRTLLEESESYNEIVVPVKLHTNNYDVSINLYQFKSFFSTDEIFKIFIRLKFADFHVDIPIKKDEKIEFESVFNGLKINLSSDQALNYYLTTKTHHTNYPVVKIGILGSCFSRTAFNSDDYFNVDYKKFYNCVFSQLYHSSIPSITSKPLNENDLNLILKNLENSDVNPTNKEYILVDLKKTFFSELKKADVDYLVLDFYSDAVKNLFMFPDGSLLGSFHVDLGELCPELEYRVISPRDDDEKIFEIYLEGIDNFAEEILKILPEEKIVLNKGTFAYQHQTENGELIYYNNNQIDLNNDINHFWDKMNNYFLSKFPNAKVIDLSYSDYYPHHDFPFNPAPMHYESAYYREFLNLLNKIVLQDKLREVHENLDETTKSKPEKTVTQEERIVSKLKNVFKRS